MDTYTVGNGDAKANMEQKHIDGLIAEYTRFLANKTESFWGSITEADEAGVALAVREAEQYDGPIVELGTMFGHTTLLLASLKESCRHLVTVDNYSWNPFCLPADVHRAFTKRTLRHAIQTANVSIFDGTTREFFSQCKTKPSLVFIDASHEYVDVLDDIDRAIACGAKVIAGHDFCEEHPGVQRAVFERFGSDITVIANVWIAKANGTGRVATQ